MLLLRNRTKGFYVKKVVLPVLFLAVLLYGTIRFVKLLPSPLFKVPYSTVVEDSQGELLSAIIADDGQWRFPLSPHVPAKFQICLLMFEDESFYTHAGVNPLAMVKALYRNIVQGKIVGGGSTITMQVIRLSRHGRPRTIREKIIEMIMAIRLELSYSKSEILAMYAAHAPFGGNVVGLEAAAWRYYETSPEMLSWGQAATLAVLPNAPSLIYPGKNDDALLQKRNRLLKKLFNKGMLSNDVYEAAIDEPLPGKPYPLPKDGIHILHRLITDNRKGERVQTTVSRDLQQQVQSIVNKHSAILAGNKVHNAAAIVIDVASGAVLAYVGNSTLDFLHDNQVDVLNARRSPGSTLKPFLYCAMLHDGFILPQAIVPDIPMIMDGFHPQNYNRTYEGAVPAAQALSRSLNVPAVHMLREYGIEKFNFFLKKAGIQTLDKAPSHYGLSVILGGAEVKPHELAGVYASMARILIRYNATGEYDASDVFTPYYNVNMKELGNERSVFADAASIWLTFQAMVEVNRPDEDQFWYHFSSRSPIAWKTGTSYGERDAWAVGVTPAYVVCVWAGNASGEGRPGLTGVLSAAPLMFEIFDYLPSSGWFQKPVNAMTSVTVCSHSGYKASEFCEKTQSMQVPISGMKTKVCPYHTLVHLDSSGKWQVNANCVSPLSIISSKRFVLPPVMEYFYKSKNPFYEGLPPFRSDCKGNEGESNFDIIYPVSGSKIFIIDEMTGQAGQVVFRAVHRKPGGVLYWHLNGDFIGTTTGTHTLSLRPLPGKHQLTVTDESGETKISHFSILNKR